MTARCPSRPTRTARKPRKTGIARRWQRGTKTGSGDRAALNRNLNREVEANRSSRVADIDAGAGRRRYHRGGVRSAARRSARQGQVLGGTGECRALRLPAAVQPAGDEISDDEFESLLSTNCTARASMAVSRPLRHRPVTNHRRRVRITARRAARFGGSPVPRPKLG